MTLDCWNGHMISKVVEDMPKLSCESRIFLAKAINVALDCKAIMKRRSNG